MLKKKNPFAVSFIHSQSIHLDAYFIPGTILGIREKISSIFQNFSKLKKIIWVCWSGEKRRGRKLCKIWKPEKKKKRAKTQKGDE